MDGVLCIILREIAWFRPISSQACPASRNSHLSHTDHRDHHRDNHRDHHCDHHRDHNRNHHRDPNHLDQNTCYNHGNHYDHNNQEDHACIDVYDDHCLGYDHTDNYDKFYYDDEDYDYDDDDNDDTSPAQINGRHRPSKAGKIAYVTSQTTPLANRQMQQTEK